MVKDGIGQVLRVEADGVRIPPYSYLERALVPERREIAPVEGCDLLERDTRPQMEDLDLETELLTGALQRLGDFGEPDDRRTSRTAAGSLLITARPCHSILLWNPRRILLKPFSG
jgi:hypothetical protein